MQIFKNPEFGEVRVVEIDSEPWLVGKDVARVLGYTDVTHSITDHVDAEDRINSKTHGQNDPEFGQRGTWLINESGLYSLVLSSKLPGAKKFRRWVTSEVLPSIRKTGWYIAPQDYPAALRALADSEEKRLALEAENAIQRQAIADFQPIKQYVDTILSSDKTLTTTQIAADYDMSAKKLNKILYEERIQHKVNKQWILYRRYMGKGYTKSKTYEISRSDGRPDTVLNTQWTQKGRLMIHEILTSRGIMAVMDRDAA